MGSMTLSSGSRELVEKFRQKFVREARMIASMKNPHIVRVHDVFEENGTAYYVMEYLPGGSSWGYSCVGRGGSWWSYNAGSCRSSLRSYYTPGRSSSRLGFRLALSE